MDNYRNHPALSQSELKATHYGNEVKIKDEDLRFHSEKRHFILGDAVDILITQPDTFNDVFHTDSVENKPTEKMMNYLHALHEKTDGEPLERLEYCTSILEDVAKEVNYLAKMSAEKIQERVLIHNDYYESITSSQNKQIISIEELDIVNKIVDGFKNHHIIGKYFEESWDTEFRFQLELYFTHTYKGQEIECKGLLDMVKFDHDKKIIYPYDIKTMGDYTFRFKKSFKQRRYDIQAAWYTLALQKNFPEYTVMPFVFIVDSTVEPGNPCAFEVSNTLMEIANYGRHRVLSNGCLIKHKVDGVNQMLDSYLFYKENGKLEHKELVENDYVIKLDSELW